MTIDTTSTAAGDATTATVPDNIVTTSQAAAATTNPGVSLCYLTPSGVLFVNCAAHSDFYISASEALLLTYRDPFKYVIFTCTPIFTPANEMRSVIVLFSLDENRHNIFLFRVNDARRMWLNFQFM